MTDNSKQYGNIRNIHSFIDNIPNWEWTNGIFTNPKIRIGDSDGMVERAGNLLLIEVKSPGKELPLGQAIMFSNLSKAGSASVVVLWGKNDTYTKIRVYNKSGKYKEFDGIDNDYVIEVLQKWEKWALNNPKV